MLLNINFSHVYVFLVHEDSERIFFISFSVCIQTYKYIKPSICMYIYTFEYICMYICVYIYVCVYICVCAYMCLYIYSFVYLCIGFQCLTLLQIHLKCSSYIMQRYLLSVLNALENLSLSDRIFCSNILKGGTHLRFSRTNQMSDILIHLLFNYWLAQ